MKSVLSRPSNEMMKECQCLSIDDFTTWTGVSNLLKTKYYSENQITFHKLIAGTLSDIFFWILCNYPDTENQSADLEGLLLSSPLYDSPKALVKTLIST